MFIVNKLVITIILGEVIVIVVIITNKLWLTQIPLILILSLIWAHKLPLRRQWLIILILLSIWAIISIVLIL